MSDELVPWPGRGRRYIHRAHVRLADAAPSGRARFDAIARWLQDAAQADVDDAGVAGSGAWVVRRNRVVVVRFPRFGEALELATFASGWGRMWAERRTTISGDGGGRVESAALWVHVDPRTGRPLPLGADFERLYLPSTAGRRVKARLQHGDPPAAAARQPWHFRRADLDVAGHVNNAAYWSVVEEVEPDPPEPAAAEVEFRAGAPAGEAELIGGDGAWWVVAGGEIAASLRLSVVTA